MMDDPSLVFVFRTGWSERCRLVAAGQSPAEAHGLFALRRREVDVEGVDDSLRIDPLRRAYSLAYQRLYAIPRSGLGYRVHQAAAVRQRLRGDPGRFVVATTDSIALPLLALRKSGSLPNPVVYLSIGLVDRLLRGGLRAGLARRYRELATRAEVIFAFAPLEVEQLSEWVGTERVRLMPLGIDTEWWHGGMPTAAERSDVLAFGRDDSRDFGTLDAAMRTLPAEAVVVGALARRQGLQARPGLVLLDDVTVDRLRGLIQAARVVVVPARPAAHGAGQTSALNAMAAGRPVVMSDTGWAAAAGLRPGHHYLDVPPSDPEALAVAIGRLLDDPEEAEAIGRRAHERVRSRLSTEAQADALLDALAP